MSPRLSHRNGTLYIDNSPVVEAAVAETFLTADVAAAATTITVKNIAGFSIGQILLIEELGTENAEIVLTHASTVPSGSTITTAAFVRAHPTGSRILAIPYNRVELKRGTTTTAGDATALTLATTANANPVSALGSGLVAIDPTINPQVQETSEHTSGYYFARYSNSVTSDFSSYTDALVYGGWAKNTVGHVIDRSLRDLDLTLSEKITRNDCFAWINECLTDVEGKQVRWPDHFKFNYQLTTLTAGDYTYALPSDIYEDESNRSILAIRIGTGGTPLSYVDPIEFEERLHGVAVTTAAEAGSVGETDIDLTDASEFATSGTIYYFVSGVQYSFTYTGKTTNTLTGIPASGTGSITEAFSSGDTMWQGITDGTPTVFTVRDGSLDVWPMPGADEHGKGIYLDYTLVATAVDSDGDEIDARRFDMVKHYLTWCMEGKALNSGKRDLNSTWYQKYKEALNDAIRTSPQTMKSRMVPRVNTMRKR